MLSASYNTTMSPLEKVRFELARYDHLLLRFSARERDGQVELLIELKDRHPEAHVYVAPLHPRDLAHSQFPWTFQKYLYDCLHDFMVELFVRTPQSQAGEQA
jgi:hypothetical protein